MVRRERVGRGPVIAIAGLVLTAFLAAGFFSRTTRAQDIRIASSGSAIGTYTPITGCVVTQGVTATTGTTQQTLGSCVIPGGSLGTVHSGFVYEATFAGAANTNSKVVGTSFAGTNLHTNTDTLSGEFWTLRLECHVKTSTSLICHGGLANNNTTVNAGTLALVTGLNLANPNTLAFFATTATQAGDITLTSWIVSWVV